MSNDAAERIVLHPSCACTWGFSLARVALVALVLGWGVASYASEPERAQGGRSGAAVQAVGAEGVEIDARIGPAGLIAAWLGVLVALAALPRVAPWRGTARRLGVHIAPGPVVLPEKAAGQRIGIGLGAIQAGEETFRVAGPEGFESAPDAAQLSLDFTAPPSAPAPPAPAPTLPASPATAVLQPPRAAAAPAAVLKQCAALREAGRFAEAARLAREGLAGGGDAGALLLELSRAELALGHVEAAIDIARDAHFASRSRESVVHLVRLLTETRRFTSEDGAALRRAASRHPRQPLLLHAAGVFESMYGRPCDAEKWLSAALPLAPDEDARRAIAGELARVEESRARGA